MSAQGVESHVSSRVDALRAHLNSHANVTADGLKTVLSGKGVNDLLAVKPVQALADVAADILDGVVNKIIVGNVQVGIDSAKSQASITRQSRG